MYENFILLDHVEEEFLQDIRDFLIEWGSDSGEIEVQTSGSTGVPKIMRFKKEQLIASAKATGAFFEFREGQSILLNLSPKYIAGKLMLVRALVFHIKVIVAPLNNNPLQFFTNTAHKIHFAAFVPAQVQSILSTPNTRKIYQEIDQVIIGGGEINSELLREISQLKNRSYATFGMTETLTHIALKPIQKKKTYFNCLPNVTVDVDSRGCLMISVPYLAEKVVTNDLVKVLDENTFDWLGRIDNIINSGGVKLSPEQIDAKIKTLLPNNRFYTVGEQSDRWGQIVVLKIEGEMETAALHQLKERLLENLDKYEVPKKIRLLKKFEETGSGKVKRI